MDGSSSFFIEFQNVISICFTTALLAGFDSPTCVFSVFFPRLARNKASAIFSDAPACVNRSRIEGVSFNEVPHDSISLRIRSSVTLPDNKILRRSSSIGTLQLALGVWAHNPLCANKT